MRAGLFLVAISLPFGASAFVVSPGLGAQWMQGAGFAAFTPSVANPIVGQTARSAVAVSVGGASRYIPIVARFGSAAVGALNLGILANPVVLAGTAALAYYAANNLRVEGDSLTTAAKPSTNPSYTSVWYPYSESSPFFTAGCMAPSSSSSAFESCAAAYSAAYGKGSIALWSKNFKCEKSQSPAPQGGDYTIWCGFDAMYLLSSQDRISGGMIARDSPVSASAPGTRPKATSRDMPKVMPDYNDVPIPLPVDSVSVGDPGSNSYQFAPSPSVKLPNGSYETTVVTATSAGTPSQPTLIDLTSRSVISTQPSTLTDARTPPNALAPTALTGVVGVPYGPSVVDSPLITPVKDPVKDPAKDPAPETDKSVLCDLFPIASACAELGSVPDVELPKSDPTAGITLGRLGSFSGGIGRCPAPTTIKGFSVDFWRPFCGFVEGLRPLLLTLASLSALMIAFGLRGRES